MRLTKLCFGAAIFSLLLLPTRSAQATILFESDAMGPVCNCGGLGLLSFQYLAARFTFTGTYDITAVGGHLQGSAVDGSIFAAIVALSGPDALPLDSPDTFIPLIDTVFSVPFAISGDYRTPLSVELGPGEYALIFGSGRFGATGNAAMVDDNTNLGATGFSNLFGNWVDGKSCCTRFVVEGTTAAPEPGTWTIVTGALGLLSWKRRSFRAALAPPASRPRPYSAGPPISTPRPFARDRS